MKLDSILSDLKAERNRLSRAIDALEETAVSTTEDVAAQVKRTSGKVYKMSAEARKQISDAKKKWWAKRKRLKLG